MPLAVEIDTTGSPVNENDSDTTYSAASPLTFSTRYVTGELKSTRETPLHCLAPLTYTVCPSGTVNVGENVHIPSTAVVAPSTAPVISREAASMRHVTLLLMRGLLRVSNQKRSITGGSASGSTIFIPSSVASLPHPAMNRSVSKNVMAKNILRI